MFASDLPDKIWISILPTFDINNYKPLPQIISIFTCSIVVFEFIVSIFKFEYECKIVAKSSQIRIFSE
jgi:hypothetical protein